MQFQIGDWVVHPIYRIGQIITVEERQFSEDLSGLYYQIVWPRCEVWVSAEIEERSNLRLVTAKNELDHFRNILKESPRELQSDHRYRHQELAQRLEQGTFQQLCEVVRDLTAWGRAKPLDPTDTGTLQKSRMSLQQEWALAASVTLSEASREIDALLLTAGLTPSD